MCVSDQNKVNECRQALTNKSPHILIIAPETSSILKDAGLREKFSNIRQIIFYGRIKNSEITGKIYEYPSPKVNRI